MKYVQIKKIIKSNLHSKLQSIKTVLYTYFAYQKYIMNFIDTKLLI